MDKICVLAMEFREAVRQGHESFTDGADFGSGEGGKAIGNRDEARGPIC